MKEMVRMENREVKKTRKKVKRRGQSTKLILVGVMFLRKKVDFV
jgi:hypothetical protein